MPSYLYQVYNNQFPGIVQENLDKMSLAGWHIHTVLPNGTAEVQVVWEHPDLPGAAFQRDTYEPDEDPEPVTVDPESVTKAELQDMARQQGLPVSGTKAELAEALSDPPLPVPPG